MMDSLSTIFAPFGDEWRLLFTKFLQARLEDMTEKDATRKSDAAREAFLAELARDPQKGAAGVDILKTKERKKSKENRKNKDQKATHSYDLQDLTAGEMYVSLSKTIILMQMFCLCL